VIVRRGVVHREHHVADRIGWLRAAVLGANDGIVSTASLILGVAAAGAQSSAIVVAGIAGLVAGAMSMAAGEYVSVSAQADTETAELDRERHELVEDPVGELAELAGIYVERGVDPDTAATVAAQLMAKDALRAHARDELAITVGAGARPVQVLIVFVASRSSLIVAVAGGSLVVLALLGGIGAKTGGANIWRGVVRVTFWGAFAMAATAAIGRLVGTAV